MAQDKANWLKARADREATAADFINTHQGPVFDALLGVVEDLAGEVNGLNQFEQDVRYAGELAYRIDEGLVLSNPILEALDRPIAFFIALIAIGIWRAAMNRSARKEARAMRKADVRDKLKARLNGAKTTAARRTRLTARIKRLDRQIARLRDNS